jgi:hypothetical protein
VLGWNILSSPAETWRWMERCSVFQLGEMGRGWSIEDHGGR